MGALEIPINLSTPEGRAHWLSLRRNDITASDVAAVCRLHPSRTPLSVWAEKTGRISPPAETELMRGGRWLEAAALQAIRETRPEWNVRPASVYLRDPALRIGATPDAFATGADGKTGVIELKVVAAPIFDNRWRNSDTITPPLEYTLQLLTAMHLGAYSWGALVALVIDAYRREIAVVDVAPDAHVWSMIREHAISFLHYIDKDEPPDAIPNLDAETVSALYPDASGPLLDMTGDIRMTYLIDEHARLSAQIEAAQKSIEPVVRQLTSVRTEIRQKLKNAEGARVGDWTITLRQRKRKAIPPVTYRVLKIQSVTETMENGDPNE